MIRRLLFSCVLIGSLGIPDVWAHHQVPGRTHPAVATIQIAEPVMAGGKPLPSGTYEVVVTDERPSTATGEPSDSQRWVEFVAKDRTVVARDIAEVFPAAERPVGTSSSSGSARAVVQKLREGDFVRVAVNGAAARYLIYLPVSR